MSAIMTNARQQGLTTVEFAIIGATMLLVLFGVIEVARAMFVTNTLAETTRRAARIAVVCPIDDPAIGEVAMFNPPGGGSANFIIPRLSPANVAVDYLDEDGNPTADFLDIRFVRARIVGFQHQMLIPFATYIFTTPAFSTTLPRESLGVPRAGVVEPC